MRLKVFNDCYALNMSGEGKSNFGFNTFLTIVECLLYYVCIIIGAYCVYKTHTDSDVYMDPFEDTETEL
jgi:hypothetical protein